MSISASEVAMNLLSGAGFGRFCFDTGFALDFVRPASVRDSAAILRLDLNCEWSMGTREYWARLVSSFPVSSVEVCEPVQAACLAALRWSEGAIVVDVQLVGPDIHVYFENGQMLRTVVDPAMEGPAWRLAGTQRGQELAIASEGGGISMFGTPE
jgi:hypothetical protein